MLQAGIWSKWWYKTARQPGQTVWLSYVPSDEENDDDDKTQLMGFGQD